VYPFLATWLGADRKNTESELEKLACYAYGHSPLSLDDVLLLLGDGAVIFANTVIDYAYEGMPNKLDRDFSRFLEQGYSPQMLLTAGIAHGFFLMEEISGGGVGTSVHFKRKPSIERQRQRWTLRGLSTAVSHLSRVQMHLRHTCTLSELECASVRVALFELALGF
jgi:DNA polymerase-3 subunit delta